MNEHDLSRSVTPEKPVLNIGFMALTDAASVIVAATQGFAEKHGLTLNLQRQASWATLRDKLLSGELDAAHSLYGLIYGVQLGLGGAPATDMAVLMGLNQNGQSINLSPALQAAGVNTGSALAHRAHQSGAKLTFAQTFPTGTHAMWLNYWLASQGIHPLSDVDSVVVPPPQMLAHLKAQRIDGFCVGEPWSALAVEEQKGCTLTTSQAIWPDHPEKVLGCTLAFAQQHPNSARALIMAVLEASQFIDESEDNRRSTAQLLSGSEYLDAPLSAIQPRFLGQYQDGLGHAWQDAHPLRFHAGGSGQPAVPVRWHVVYDPVPPLGAAARGPGLPRGVARQVQQLALYRQAAEALGLAVPAEMRSSQLLDGQTLGRQRPGGLCPQLCPACAMTDVRRSAHTIGEPLACCASC